MAVMARASLALAATILLPNAAQAQTWNKEQAEVWQFISSIWERHNQTGTWHETLEPNGYGWWTGYPVPTSRQTMARQLTATGAGKVLFYRLDPLAITVSGDTAMVFYFAQEVEAADSGKRQTSTSRCADTLVKRSGQWRVLGWFCEKKSAG